MLFAKKHYKATNVQKDRENIAPSEIMRSDRPSLPTNRAFVVQLHADAAVVQGLFKGRVEHIVSMDSTHFNSIEELVTFIVRLVTETQDKDD